MISFNIDSEPSQGTIPTEPRDVYLLDLSNAISVQSTYTYKYLSIWINGMVLGHYCVECRSNEPSSYFYRIFDEGESRERSLSQQNVQF